MNILAKSTNYQLVNEYEVVTLTNLSTDQEVIVGDFYGEPAVASISNAEDFCVIGGCGIVVYFLQYPFLEYQYHTSTPQWKEWHRYGDDIIWVERINIIDIENVIVIDECGNEYSININNMCDGY